jgi:hypothetical protein
MIGYRAVHALFSAIEILVHNAHESLMVPCLHNDGKYGCGRWNPDKQCVLRVRNHAGPFVQSGAG